MYLIPGNCFYNFLSIANNEFFGLSTSSSMFIRNTVVIPQDSISTGLAYNIRDNALLIGETATAELYINTDCGNTPTATSIIATMNAPNPPNCCAPAPLANLFVSQCTLISVRITTGDGAFAGGAAATILCTIL